MDELFWTTSTILQGFQQTFTAPFTELTTRVDLLENGTAPTTNDVTYLTPVDLRPGPNLLLTDFLD